MAMAIKRIIQGHPPEAKKQIKVTDFQVVTHQNLNGYENVLIYALGEDGVVREYADGRWTPFPIR
jgi:hypothetical protein